MRKRLLYALVLIVLASLFCFSFTACKDDENPDNGESCSHTYSDTYTCHDRRCTLCNEVLSATTNHDFTYGDCPCGELNTCQHNFNTPHTCLDRTCTECGSIILATTNHNYVDYECTVCNMIRAPENPSEGLSYELDDSGDYYIIIGCGDFNDAILSIPEKYNNKDVKKIADSAFNNNDIITKAFISNNIIDIGKSAFYDCDSLTSIIIGDNVTNIGEDAFAYCYELKNVTIGSSVKNIEIDAFSMCPNITRLNYTGTIDQWVQISFAYHTANPMMYTKNLYINNNLITTVRLINSTYISNWAFAGSNFNDVIIGENIKKIGYGAFYRCGNSTSVIFKDVNGWWVSTSSTVINGGAISSNDVSNITTVTKYLKSNFYDYYWFKHH